MSQTGTMTQTLWLQVDSLLILLIALALDAIFGEPDYIWKRVPHPVRLMGAAIQFFDTNYNTGDQAKTAGVIGLVVACVGLAVAGFIIQWLPFNELFEIIVVAILVAHKSLIGHVSAVANSLRMSLMEGRLTVAKIVGRDTGDMDQTEVVRAAIESTAEGFMDGVVAPAFWYLIGGIPGILIYKFVNTADSMIGFKNEQYEDFGWATARLDDILNFIPARLTAALVALAHFSKDVMQFAMDEGKNHRSPNAGWPEAAFAKVMDVALSGPRSYQGTQVEYPFINSEGRHELAPEDIETGVGVAWRTWMGLCGLILVLEVVLLNLF